MKRIPFCIAGVICALILVFAASVAAQTVEAPNAAESKFVYADFQNLQNGRPVSKRGGLTRLNKYAQNPANTPQFRGLEKSDPPAPAPARVTADDTAAAFDYELRMPNDWAGVNMEVFGEPEKDGKLVPDDVSEYKFITLRVFTKTARSIRIELISRGQGSNLESGYPSAVFRVSPGFNMYKLKLDSFGQPEWAMPLDLKRDVLKKLTSVTIGVFCEKCVMETGTVVVDNIAFEK
jgi:hypothetical protein